jgi:2,4-dienoyl-CoA reductase (NADPH2)
VARLPIEVKRGRALAPEEVRGLAADAVVVATGGRIVLPVIPGADRRHVTSGPQLRQLLRPAARWLSPPQLRAATRLWMPFGKRVVVVGADLAALELAELLALRGRRVTIVERGERLAPEVGHKRLTEHMDALDRLGVAVNTGVAYEEITERGIAIRPERGSRHEIAADTIIVAGELEADTAFFDAVKGDVPEAYTVGDCTGLGLIRKATEEATRVAAAL